jgi:short-subunit dehydrogenase
LVRTNIFQAAVNGREERPMRIPPAWMCASPEAVAYRAVQAVLKNRGLVVVTPMARFLWYFKRLSPSLLSWISGFGKRKKIRRDAEPMIEAEKSALSRAA